MTFGRVAGKRPCGQRERLLRDMQSSRLANPVIAGGDLHCAVVADVPGDPERFDSAPVASEFVGSEKCGTCHAAEFKTWQDSYHAKMVRTPQEALLKDALDKANNPEVERLQRAQQATQEELERARAETNTKGINDQHEFPRSAS